jgi:HAD superfamily hydrolase (TIGR01549 family)
MPFLRTQRLRAIFFDAGNTLVRMNYAAIAARLAALGQPATPEGVQRAEWRARVRVDDDVFARPGTSTESAASRASYLQLLLEELGMADEAILQAMTAWRRDYNAPVGLFDVVDPEGKAAVALARSAGLQVGVISNSNGTVRGLLKSLGLGQQLDFVIDSFEVGVEKPDARIFALALARARLEAREAIYVGDLYSVDVCGARGAGIDAILLDPGGHWGRRDCRLAPDPLAATRLALTASPAPDGVREPLPEGAPPTSGGRPTGSG